jgi:hypothetical protein
MKFAVGHMPVPKSCLLHQSALCASCKLVIVFRRAAKRLIALIGAARRLTQRLSLSTLLRFSKLAAERER